MIWQGDTTIGVNGLVINPRMPLEVNGPTIQVCFALKDSSMRIRGDSIFRTGEPGAHPNAFLRDSANRMYLIAGNISPLPEVNSTFELRDKRTRPPTVIVGEQNGLTCLRHHYDSIVRDRFVSVYLRSDQPIEITRITWWSGELRPVL